MKNKYGLSRYIPKNIKQIVRKECGFGCVICTSALFEYEHIDPEFKDAKFHDPSAIALLCGTCHTKVTRGRISKETVKKFRANPQTKINGFSSDWFDFDENQPLIEFGGSLIYNCPIPVEFNGFTILRIDPPEKKGLPIRLSAYFLDEDGNLSLIIVENEFKIYSSIWDMDFVGNKLTIKNKNNLVLSLHINPPNKITIDYLKMQVKGDLLICENDTISIFRKGGGIQKYIKAYVHDCGRAGFSF